MPKVTGAQDLVRHLSPIMENQPEMATGSRSPRHDGSLQVSADTVDSGWDILRAGLHPGQTNE